MQTAVPGTYSGMLDCAGRLLKNEGPLAFYKGTLTPLLGIGVCVSIQFGAAERTKRFFAERNRHTGFGGPNGTQLSGVQLALSGSAAGLANSVVSGPVEHIRIRMSFVHTSWCPSADRYQDCRLSPPQIRRTRDHWTLSRRLPPNMVLLGSSRARWRPSSVKAPVTLSTSGRMKCSCSVSSVRRVSLVMRLAQRRQCCLVLLRGTL
jgi:hypothetical protein